MTERIRKDLFDAAKRVLAWQEAGCDPSDKSLADLKTAIAEAEHLYKPRNTRDNEIIDIARTDHGCDEIEIDDDAAISEGNDNGAFVQAWVWASFSGSKMLDKEEEK